MLDRWPDFAVSVASRLEKGREVYGDRSFTRSPGELIAEIREELEDVAGWGFVLWCRLHDLEQRLAERIAGAYLLPQPQKNRHQNPCADPQDRPNRHSSSGIVRRQESTDDTHAENRKANHHGHYGEHSEAEVGRVGHALVSPEADRGCKVNATAKHRSEVENA